MTYQESWDWIREHGEETIKRNTNLDILLRYIQSGRIPSSGNE